MFKKIAGFALLFVFLLSFPVSALYIRTGGEVVIAEGTIIDDNLFAAADEITVSGHIKGDAICLGADITIDGKVDGSIIAAGGDVIVSGTARNVFVVGGDVSIAGVVKNDLLAGCGQLITGKKSRIGKDAFVGCGNARIAGKIYRDLWVGAGTMKIAPGALIKGKLDYSAENVDISENTQIFGAITSYARPELGRQAAKFFAGVALTCKIVSLLAALILGILIIIFFPNQVKMVASAMLNKFWRNLGWGIVWLIVTPVIALLLFMTLIGIPLGVLLSFLYLFGIYTAGIFISVVIGKAIFDRLGRTKISLIWSLLLGLIIYNLIGLIPLLGGLIKFVLFLWAFGALVASIPANYKMAREKGAV